jgi:hypothetical protein
MPNDVAFCLNRRGAPWSIPSVDEIELELAENSAMVDGQRMAMDYKKKPLVYYLSDTDSNQGEAR